MIRVARPLLRLRAEITRRLVCEVTAAEAFPSAEHALHVPRFPIETPDVRALPLAEPCRALWREPYRTREGYTATLPGVLYYPEQNLILSPNRSVIVTEHHGRIRPERLHWKPRLRRRIADLPGVTTSLRSFRWSYYRTLIDQLPLLYVLGHAGEAVEGPVRLVYEPPLSPAEQHFVPGCLPPGVELCPVEPGSLYRLERYLYASYLSWGGFGGLPRVYLDDFLRAFAPRRPRTRDRLVYISRAGAEKGRRVLNEDRLLTKLGPLGFERVVLEELTIPAQIDLFHDAACVVAPHGAGLANLLFCEDAAVVELFPQPVVWPHYYVLCCSLGLRYRFLCGTERRRHASFDVDVEAVTRIVDELLTGSPGGIA